jgi:hypothetical protein
VGGNPKALSLAGLLLLLQIAILYLLRARVWTVEPMARANLGSVLPLHACRHPDQVSERLESWRKRLACRWDDHDDEPVNGPAARRMRDLLGEVVWRDMIGPLYTLVLAFGQWFLASQVLRRHGGIYDYWWALPALALASDYLEDFCHLRYRTLHAAGAKPSAAVDVLPVDVDDHQVSGG